MLRQKNRPLVCETLALADGPAIATAGTVTGAGAITEGVAAVADILFNYDAFKKEIFALLCMTKLKMEYMRA